ncbi:LacI family DNA-binding transcriptional regulator [Salinactinospora qingdaonensis]|uniref:LacI family DNA-binding transcriptional regulator n=1 Tax=Salinactinospora qingdaonensis TaxID=702744 RepID=A0ABP7GG57_9ACTN
MTEQRRTLAQIAEEAGVSVPTVSKVLNGHLDVAVDTRRQVERLLEHHRYTPRKSRAQRKVGLIDLVFVDLGSPWAMEILAGVEESAHEAGFGTVVSAVHDRRGNRSTRKWLDNVRARDSDGVVLVLSGLSPTQQAQLDLLRIPVILIDPVGVPQGDVPAVGATNWSGGLNATEHLIEKGHRRIATISGPKHLLCSRARVDGYRSAMSSAGLEVPHDYVRYGDFLSPSGYTQAQALLDLPEPPTAIFAGSDLMALGVYEALFERGLRVPEDISVVGFDDLPETQWARPPLTTVRQPLEEMAQIASRMLFRLIRGEELESTRMELATSFVERSSTAAPPE